jgi:hypothetical protein
MGKNQGKASCNKRFKQKLNGKINDYRSPKGSSTIKAAGESRYDDHEKERNTDNH